MSQKYYGDIKMITVRMTEENHQKIKDFVRNSGGTIQDFIFKTIMGKINKESKLEEKENEV